MKRSDLSLCARIALASFIASACAPLPPSEPRRLAPGGGAHREEAMNHLWRNRPMSELVAALGPPTMVMTIPGGGSPPGFAMVFGRDPATGCIDAFAMMYATDPIVRNYYCR